ncbi:MOSC domain-containing protein [Segetibacter aerophilus]|uniref:MOSC domain-containing protein n=1 Tax=Segetibacter aerophilus TaxID=670293 RepID=A0A512BAE4_9BACT|nr:MOSC N-terminal beta barrel domain-containing protein [Segetibacter aerophilus]GEO08923.1 MOSC domain-containing protein [Segetibacter aerophilus]
MEDLFLQDIYIYPIKSLGGISLTQAEVLPTGLQYDRRWMLTDEKGNFLSQRAFAEMAMLQVSITSDGLLVSHKKRKLQPLTLPFDKHTGKEVTVKIWDDVCTALEVGMDANRWFSEALGMTARLVYMPDTTRRLVDNHYASNNEIVSFADAYPLLMIGQSSLDDLNKRLEIPVLMNRFRPNLVFCGAQPYAEDLFKEFRVGEVAFAAVKPCARCVLTTVNQEDGVKGQEPLKTLASFRTFNNKILFGQNLLPRNLGLIKTGDNVEILSTSIET